MTPEEITTLTSDFDDFLFKVVRNYKVPYSSLAEIIMARMVQLAQICDDKEALLDLLPSMQDNLSQ